MFIVGAFSQWQIDSRVVTLPACMKQHWLSLYL